EMKHKQLFVHEENQEHAVHKDYHQMRLASSRVCDRNAHRDAWAESMTIFETQNDKA
ncbi:cobyrinic acid ac-diamide synthase, partial [Klebsiella pneumoniae]|nr:cobyrinic acid ac-diamide synthase [Klebsiella pneumoniae]